MSDPDKDADRDHVVRRQRIDLNRDGETDVVSEVTEIRPARLDGDQDDADEPPNRDASDA